MKLWKKNKETLKSIEHFTIGKDPEFDIQLAPFDVIGSLAHTLMLESIGLLSKMELKQIHQELKTIYQEIETGHFAISHGVEDIHSQIEILLTKRLGEIGKKIHAGRSRNDQILLDLRLFLRNEIKEIINRAEPLFKILIDLSEKHKDKLLPGYTHLQIAMPSSFGLWFGAYAESLVDDLELMLAAWRICNKNPLGSAAGYGSSFPLNRTLTTKLLGFDALNYNVVYAQMGRGKTERILAQAMANLASTLAKLSMDVCLYMCQNFGFISFPDELTTGSSIMPHKKNPDVFELIRGRCNSIQALPHEIALLTTNLPSGYHRDLQLLKEKLFPTIASLKDCLEMAAFMLKHIQVKNDILKDKKYQYLFSVEAVNEEVLKGIAFREAYKKIATEIEEGLPINIKEIKHTHEGSIGNLNNNEITHAFYALLSEFNFSQIDQAIASLL